MMSEPYPSRLTSEEVMAEGGTLLPAKEVLSLLDLNVDLDLALDLAAPIDLAVAANANVAAPINAAVGANVLSLLSGATAASVQDVGIDQQISGEAIATAPQTSVIDQSNDVVDGGTVATEPVAGEPALDPATDAVTGITDPALTDVGSVLDGDLLNVDVNVALDADLAAPIAGAVAANANVAAPINASVAANVGAVGSEATAIASQQGTITQNLEDVVAEATADQDSTITQ
jgi:hypothetical protein